MKQILTLIFVILYFNINAQNSLDYYFPKEYTYNQSIIKPAEYLGFEIGDWHLSHELITGYLQKLTEASDRIKMESYGKSYEQKPLQLLIISSPKNLANLEDIRKQHVQWSDPTVNSDANISNMPVVVWLGYSVHGNEPSGANASVLVAYHLAAAQGTEIDELLQNAIIIIDPTINPDGLNRFAQWANANKSKALVADPADREHNENWPRGRTNHYWFDLNRDWLPLQHPESKGRIDYFHRWKPNVLTDHHEMGTNSTFFFQPGIPSRTHPLTPGKNQELTRKIAEYHAKALEKGKVLYYTQESFDDFYYGKGSTYPDVNGSIGILFEQASSRGHLQESIHGTLSFSFTIRNQFMVSLSTLAAARAMKNELLNYQKEFYENAINLAGNQAEKAYVVTAGNDIYRLKALAEILEKHEINYSLSNESYRKNSIDFPAEKSLVVLFEQKQYKLIEAIFETRTEFTDSLFYDISAWNFPMAMHLHFAKLRNNELEQIKTNDAKLEMPIGKVHGDANSYAYILPWHYQSGKALYQILNRGLKASVATDTIEISGGNFLPGSIVVPTQQQPMSDQQLYEYLQKIAEDNHLAIIGVKSGLSFSGASLGSPSLESLQKPAIALLSGDGVSSYESGEMWHLLDQRFAMPVTKISVEIFSRVDLNRYNVILMPNGSYGMLSTSGKEKLTRWLQDGGTLIAVKGAVSWLHSQGISKSNFLKMQPDTTGMQKNYSDYRKARDAKDINGTIFKGIADLTHPINYGINTKEVFLFKNGNYFMQPVPNPFANPVIYTSNPLVSGYVAEEVLDKVSNSAAISLNSYGRGLIVNFADNPNFRAFWYGTNRFFINSIFFGNIISRSSAR